MYQIIENGEFQDILFIPTVGIIGYTYRGVDFFSNDPETIDEAERVVHRNRKVNDRQATYIGQVDLPNDVLQEAINAGKKYADARRELDCATAALKRVGKQLIENIPK